MADVKGVTRRVFKVFWAWQDREEEQWLEQMALAGWSLARVSGISYTFERSEPQKMIYRFLVALVVLPTPLRLIDGWWLRGLEILLITSMLALVY